MLYQTFFIDLVYGFFFRKKMLDQKIFIALMKSYLGIFYILFWLLIPDDFTGLSRLKFGASGLSHMQMRLHARLINRLSCDELCYLSPNFWTYLHQLCCLCYQSPWVTSLHVITSRDEASTRRDCQETGAFWKQNSWKASRSGHLLPCVIRCFACVTLMGCPTERPDFIHF